MCSRQKRIQFLTDFSLWKGIGPFRPHRMKPPPGLSRLPDVRKCGVVAFDRRKFAMTTATAGTNENRNLLHNFRFQRSAKLQSLPRSWERCALPSKILRLPSFRIVLDFRYCRCCFLLDCKTQTSERAFFGSLTCTVRFCARPSFPPSETVQGSPHQRLLMMQQPRAHKPGAGSSAGGKAKVEEEELLIASLTNAVFENR